jgi:Ca2+-binding EF-hand superfamily protein
VFELKPVIMRAYMAARDKLKSKNSHGDDYVSKGEFKYLLKYLRQYYEYFLAFDKVDTDDDRRIDKDEFAKAVPIMKNWGIEINDVDETFKEVDSDGHGKILFKEFSDWAIRKNLDLEDDDDAL